MGSIDVFLMFTYSETTLVQTKIVIYKNCHLTPLCAHGEERQLKNGLAGLSKNTKAYHQLTKTLLFILTKTFQNNMYWLYLAFC